MLVPQYTGVQGSEMADELDRKGASDPYRGPEPFFDIPTYMFRPLEKWEYEKRTNIFGKFDRAHRGQNVNAQLL